jgi:ParB-like partition proteins
MVAKKGGLGKGLGALLSDLNEESQPTTEIDIAFLQPNPFQPRKVFDQEKLEELAESIKVHGLIQPLIVRKMQNGYQIVAGERRWRASKLAGLSMIPVVVRELEDKEMMSIALIENIQRQDLNVIEEAITYKKLMEEYVLTQEELAAQIGKSRSQVANTLRMLNLPPEIQTHLSDQRISVGHAKVLLGIMSKDLMIRLCERIIERDLSVREAEALIQDMTKSSRKINRTRSKDIDVVELENNLQRIFGAKVKISGNSNKGKVVIEYYTEDDLERILEILGNISD